MNLLIEFEKKPLLFSKPEEVIACYEPSALKEAIDRIEEFIAKKFYVAGFFSYEAGYCLEEKLCQAGRYDFPLLCMGAYKMPQSGKIDLDTPKSDSSVKDINLSITKEAYSRHIERIRDYIRLGDVYQITYCLKMHFSFAGSAFGLYRRLFRSQPVPYPAYLETDDFKILSLSPEMFMKKKNDFISTKPMKGTWPRNIPFMDLGGLRLKYDRKNRAENVMIADLLRNDLGRIGSHVRAPVLFEVRRYNTLYQMTSTATARIDRDISIYRLFKALFPSGSVTGAPKIRAMEIIRELEGQERRIYTGAIGYITPDKDLFFNIPIRTLLLRQGKGEMGIGGGIVWDSTPEGEWEEGLLKARFLTEIAE